MIPADAELTAVWLPVTALRIDLQPINWDAVITYARLLAGADHAEGHCAPPLVDPPDTAGLHHIRDGRHRYLGHLLARRSRIRCLRVDPAQEDR